MGGSLEDRVPFLDPAVDCPAWRMPFELQAPQRTGKWNPSVRSSIVRSVRDRGPTEDGFGIPLASWLRGPLRDWAEDLLSPERLGREGFLDPYRSGASGQITSPPFGPGVRAVDILMFQAWLQSRGVDELTSV